MELALQTPTMKWEQLMVRVRPYARTFLTILAVLAIAICLTSLAIATTTSDEFTDSASRVEGWVSGNLGKTIVVGGLIISLAVFAWTRQFQHLFLPLIAAVIIGVIVGVINSSFTAII